MQKSTLWQDAQGRQWTARVTIAQAARIKSEGFDLLDPKQLSTIVDDPLQVVTLICRIHADQAAQSGLSTDDFAELCTETEEVAIAAAEALVEGLADFFCRIRKPALASVVRKANQAAKAVESHADKMLEERGAKVLETVIADAARELDRALDEVASRGKRSGNTSE